MSTSHGTVKTRIFIISDTHSQVRRSSISQDSSFRPPFPRADVLIHAGDLTGTGTIEEHKLAIELLASIPAELKLVIAGNHDLNLDKEYYLAEDSPAKHIGGEEYNKDSVATAEELWKGQEAKTANVTYLTEGVHEFELENGAKLRIYASEWQPRFFKWAFNYEHNEDRWNPPEIISKVGFPKRPDEQVIPATRSPHPIPVDEKIDIMVTHGPPWFHRDKCFDGNRAGCPQLLQALDRVRPKVHCFGHIHESWGAERVTWRETLQSPAQPEWSLDYKNSSKLGETSELLGHIHRKGEEEAHIQCPDDVEVIERRAAYLDVSSESDHPLQYGKESLLINASIMNLRYKPKHAGWLIDLDLPRPK